MWIILQSNVLCIDGIGSYGQASFVLLHKIIPTCIEILMPPLCIQCHVLLTQIIMFTCVTQLE